VLGQEKETVPRVIHSPLLGLQGGASERSTLFSLPWMKKSQKNKQNQKFKKQKRMKMKMKGWGGGTCETKLNAYTMI
jgi:hypothetical protein